jgi:hypothetical protein
MRQLALLLALALAPKATVRLADQEGLPFPYVVSTVNTHVSPPQGLYFKMSTNANDPRSWDGGVGVAFKVQAGDADLVLWKTSGWYASRVFLATDGKHLVRIGNWPRGRKPQPDHLAVAFYADGQLVKSYSTVDLIKDMSKVQASTGHYGFLGSESMGFVKFVGPMEHAKDDTQFELTMVDGVHYVFSVADGTILSSSQK